MQTLALKSKSFLLGEYAVLRDGPALLASTAPEFTLQIESSSEGGVIGIHPASPAGKFLSDHRSSFENYRLQFIDPHQGKGGFGASSAQFASVYKYYQQYIKQQEFIIQEPKTLSDTLEIYQFYAQQNKGYPPSGADVVAQLNHNITLFSKPDLQCRSYHWPFQDIGFMLCHTGNKIASHEHLAMLGNFSPQRLNDICWQAIDSLQQQNSNDFTLAIDRYAIELAKLNLVHPMTLSLISELQQSPNVLAVKGCGALGADVICVIYRCAEKDCVLNIVNALQLFVVAGHEDI